MFMMIFTCECFRFSEMASELQMFGVDNRINIRMLLSSGWYAELRDERSVFNSNSGELPVSALLTTSDPIDNVDWKCVRFII